MKRNKLAVVAFSAALLTGCDATQTDSQQQRNIAEAASFWPQLDLAIQKDPEIERQIVKIMDGMTLEQKVAQVIQPEIRDITVEDMRKYGFGSYLNGGGAYPGNNKHATVQDWVALAEKMYQASVDASMDGSSIPTMWGTDAVHGHNNVIGATLFPHNIGLGAAHNPQLIKKIAQATSVEVQATGIDWVFAPTVATARDDRWGRTYESYSEDPEIVRAYSAAIVEGLQGDAQSGFFADDKVIATVKHFIGDGGTLKGDDQGDNVSEEHELFEIHAQGYVGGLTAGAQTVMASFNSWHGKKIHGDKYLLTTVLKDRMGFDGLVVGDWNGHGQIAGCDNSSCPQAMNAGLDIYMVPTSAWKPLYENLIQQVKSGVIPMSRLDDAVTRILRVKLRAGLFSKPSPANRVYAGREELIGADAHRALAREAVRASLVLLKNDDNLLPLSPAQRILVAGDAADNIGKQSGGWTITWQGTGNENSDFPGAHSIYDGIKKSVTDAGGEVELSVSGDYSVKPDVAIVVFGEEPYAEGNGDLDNLEYQRGVKRDLALLKSLQAQDIPVVSVFISGRPLWVNPELNASDAFVAAWLPGSEGQGIADVLFRDTKGDIVYDFTGKLSFSWPATPNQHPNRHDMQNKPLFAYGYGLSYAGEHDNLPKLDESRPRSQDTLGDKALYQGSVKKPWSLAGSDKHQQVAMNSSVLETSQVNVRTADRRIQEDTLEIVLEDEGRFGLYAPFPVDYRGYVEAKAVLRFDYRLATEIEGLVVRMRCLDACQNQLEITKVLNETADNNWHTLAIPLACFTEQGVKMDKIISPFELQANGQAALAISDIMLQVGDNHEQQNTRTVSCQ